jgi:hypothetical protein
MVPVHFDLRRKLATLAALTLLLLLTGCGSGYHTVTGRVTFDDGSPLDAGTVVCEGEVDGKKVMARGTLQPDGSFTLGTTHPGDGVPAGKYRVLVVPRSLFETEKGTRPPIIDPKFEKFATSNLSLEVKPGRNELPITVTKPKQWRAQKESKAG